jgi:hypothetical protein
VSDYQLRVEDQASAVGLLTTIGALAEIEHAVVSHCTDYAPEPPYSPQEIKKRLAPSGWVPEVRVPPFDPQYDELPINERYDMWKPFELAGERIGVAIEMERWEVWNDLLKFRRGIERGQIAVGVILHDNPESLSYVYNHLRLISEPLFGLLPVAFVAPEGEGLKEPSETPIREYAPYHMPADSILER